MSTVVRQVPPPVPDEPAETNSELHRWGVFVMTLTFSTLEAVIQAQGNGPNRFLDFSFVAIVFSLAFSVLHLRLHCNLRLRLPLARLFLPLAAFFTTVAVGLLISNSISPSMRWVPFAVFFSTLLVLGYFELFPAILHCVAALWRSFVFHIGPAADDVDMQSSSNQLSQTSSDHEQPIHYLHGEISETAAPADQLELGMMGRSEPALHTPQST